MKLFKAFQKKSLHFPNPSRSFDDTSDRVRFWGYDRSIEISFFVGFDVLKKLQPEMRNAEAGFLTAFDAVRDRIHEIAERVYMSSQNESFVITLTAEDF